MSWRNKPGGKAVKPQRRKTLTRRQAPKAARRRKPSAVDANEKIEILERRLNEALERQTATSEVLKVISSSPGDLAPVFQAMLENATRICEANFGHLFLTEEGDFRVVALQSVQATYPDWLKKGSKLAPLDNPHGPLAQLARTRKFVHITDLAAEQAYIQRNVRMVALVEASGARTFLGVPMFKDEGLNGAIVIYRQEARPFSDKQIELVQNFAAQAVIAIENARLLSELRESLQQQTATADVLKVISQSAFDLPAVLDTLIKSACHLCEADIGTIRFEEGDRYRLAATYGCKPEWHKHLADYSGRPDRTSVFGQTIVEGRTVHIPDVLLDPDYARPQAQKLMELRAALGVPLTRNGQVFGVVNLFRTAPRPFTAKQIDLAKTFADQAVIAIENVRLFEAEQQRTQELSESLEQQTATSEVLKIISSSPGELESVFQAILENATRICQAGFGTLNLYDGDAFQSVALHNPPPQYAMRKGQVIYPHSESALAYVARTKQIAHIDDLRTRQPYLEGHKAVVDLVDLAGARTLLVVPMLKEGDLVGTISIYRQEVRSFTDKQIELVQNFAAQAVIAIENTRLLSELRESLAHQMATSEILASISGSMTDSKPVFDAIVRNLLRLFDTRFATVQLYKDGTVEMPAAVGAAGIDKIAEHYPRPLDEDTVGGQAMVLKRVVQISPLIGNPLAPAVAQQMGREFGYNSIIAAPMILQDNVIGAIVCAHHEPRVFSEKEVALIKSFADQAVIAIENGRLFDEVQARTRDLTESLQQQTATADVLKVISRSTFDLQTVLQTLVESAARLCDADKATITRQKDGVFYSAEAYGFSREFMDYIEDIPIEPDRGSASGRALLEGRVVHIPDVRTDPEYTFVAAQRLGDYRTILCVPMLREGVPIGVLILTRSEVRPFTDKQIELVTTFADQAAIAIENVRLFESVEARTRELAKSLEELRTAQDRLVQTEKLASLGQLTAGIAHEIKNPLNFVNNFSAISVELIDELREALAGANLDTKLRAQINEVADMLQGNLDKVVQHGKRADSIVKNMLLHSRQGSQEHRPVDINAIVEESLNLAYHGARAEKQGFNITLETVLGSDRRRDRSVPAGDHPGAAQPDLKRLLRRHEAQSGRKWRQL